MSFFGAALDNLTSLFENKYSITYGIKSKARKISTTLVEILPVVGDAEKKQLTDSSIKEWLQQLKDTVHAVEDFYDEIRSHRFKGSPGFNLRNIIFRHKIEKRLDEFTRRLDEIADRKNKFLLQKSLIAKESLIQRRHRDENDIEAHLFIVENIWRLVGLVSSVVGVSCYALTPSFNRLIGTRKPFKLIAYGVLSLALITTILFANKLPSSTRHNELKSLMSFAVLIMLSEYTFFYDRAVNGKPDILNVVSNAAFVLVSLSLHKLFYFGFEIGVFSFFFGCFTVQLITINQILILIPIVFGYPLFKLHSSPDSQPEVAPGGQVSHSSNYGLVVGSDGQHVLQIDS